MKTTIKLNTQKKLLNVQMQLSTRYIHDRHLPDKAIDLIDEAGATKRLEIVYTPPEIRELEIKRQGLEAKKLHNFNEQDFETMSKFQVMITTIEEA